jgi:anti-sigma B factor antagonist
VRGLKVDLRNGADDVLLSIHGEIDLVTAPQLEAALERARPSERGRLVVDLRGVSFLDSTGLVLLLRHQREAAAGGRRLIVVKGPPHVQRVLDITGMSERLTMVDEPPS